MAHHRRSGLIEFVESYKLRPEELMLRLRKSSFLTREVRKPLESAVKGVDWPSEFRSWEAVLLGLVGAKIGEIASVVLRESAAKRLFRSAKRIGLSRSGLLMIVGDIGRIEKRVKRARISIP